MCVLQIIPLQHSHKMETISHQESAATTTDSKETKPDQQERDRCTIVAGQRDGSKVSPLLSSQNLSKRALVDSLSSGCCFDEGELDYDESMEGDRERAAISAAGCCEEAGSVATREVEEGEVTSDEEGEVKGECVWCACVWVGVGVHVCACMCVGVHVCACMGCVCLKL